MLLETRTAWIIAVHPVPQVQWSMWRQLLISLSTHGPGLSCAILI